MTEEEMKAVIARFLKAWTKWVEDGATQPHYVFDRSHGLCNGLSKFMRRVEMMHESSMSETREYFFVEMLNSDNTPFNRGNQKHYNTERCDASMHKNQARRMWAYQTLRELTRDK